MGELVWWATGGMLVCVFASLGDVRCPGHRARAFSFPLLALEI